MVLHRTDYHSRFYPILRDRDFEVSLLRRFDVKYKLQTLLNLLEPRRR